MTNYIEKKVTFKQIDEGSIGQKIDNFLIKILKGVPKSHIYKLLRTGQVRVNKKRVKTEYKLCYGDILRIPPVDYKEKVPPKTLKIDNYTKKSITNNILFEDDYLLVINKPHGLAVHGGSGLSFGVIELIRQIYPNEKFLELIHRLDKETSGVLLIAKKRAALVEIQKQIREKRIHKKYMVAVSGLWKDKQKTVNLNLVKLSSQEGQKVIVVDNERGRKISKESKSVFFLNQHFRNFTLLDVKLITGRTHQIRVHLAHLGFPVLGDQRYGDFKVNKELEKTGFKRMFLHACQYGVIHPKSRENLFISAPLPEELRSFIDLK